MTDELEKVNTRSIWLLLLREGGRWQVGEISKELGASDHDLVCRFTYQMCERGYIRRHWTKGERNSYSVDRKCKIPLALTVGELQDAGALS